MAQTSSGTSGVQATTVAIASPSAVAYDAAGNLYVALRDDHVVRRVDTLGVITVVAGTGQQGFGGDGGAATSALLDTPTGIALDGNGNLFIADRNNQRIRLVSNGTITTIAGSGAAGFQGDGGSATLALLDLPSAVSVDRTGAVYVADSGNQRIRKITAGVITTVAGTGEEGFGGDGGAALQAQLDFPAGVLADPSANNAFYIADTRNQRLRAVAADGTIRTIAGTGAAAFGGDGGPAAQAALAMPRGVAINTATGALYVADADNQRIRSIVSGQIATAAGSGEQGFSGDLGAPTSAALDTPHGVAVSTAGVLAVADTHNQRVRSIGASAITTVAGIAPVATEGLLIAGPTTGIYGATIGTLTAVFSNGGNTASGSATLSDAGNAIATATLSGNTVTFSLNSLAAGLHSLTVSYSGDASNPPTVSGTYLVNVAMAAQTISFPALQSPISYTPGLTAALAATSSAGLPIIYTVTGPATITGTTLMYTGAGTVTVTATQAGSTNYAAATASQTVTVLAAVTGSGGANAFLASALSPASAPLGATGVQLTVTGSGFSTTSVIQVNGTSLVTSFFNGGTLMATLPALLTPGTLQITVYDPTLQQTTGALSLLVATTTAQVTLTGPGTSSSGQQPTVGVQLQQVFPVPLTGVFTLTFAPQAANGVDDPAIQFATGGRTLNFTIPANSTTVPAVTLQTGTVAGTITLSLSLTAFGVDVTPATARSVAINIPAQVPSATVTYVQAGQTLTVSVLGFSNVRNVSQATFKFKPAPGTDLAQSTETLPVTTLFGAGWFDTAASTPYGSSFLYVQTFQLGDAGAKIDGVTVTLTNTVGDSQPANSP